MPYTEDRARKCCKRIAAKLAAASETARPLFCMPTSIAIAVVLEYSTWKIFAARKPSIIPQKLWIATTPSTRTPQLTIFSAFTATIPPMIITIATTDTSGITSDTLSTCSPARLRRKTPRRTGIRITFTTEITIAQKDTSTQLLPEHYTRNGVHQRAASVEDYGHSHRKRHITSCDIGDHIAGCSARTASHQDHSQCQICRKVHHFTQKPGDHRHNGILSHCTDHHFFGSGKNCPEVIQFYGQTIPNMITPRNTDV